MKKIISFLLVAILLVGTSITVLAHEQNTIEYNGRIFNKSELTLETIEWLEWYNCLPEESRLMISHEPAELRDNATYYTMIETDEAQQGAESIIMPASVGLLPTSGYEPVYNPDYWNAKENIKRANCYAYAMDVICTTEMKLQPGELSGQMYTSLTESAIFTAVQNDGPYLGNGRTISRAERDDTPGTNQYKVALVIAPNLDYHWYIQNSDGYWSHKRGTTEATNVDASGYYITDPQTCDRNYGGLNYSTFCGYYLIIK